MKQSTRVRKALGIALGAALVAGTVTLPAYASLGGDATSVDTDVQTLKAQSRATPGGGYTINELTLPSGTVVHEYVSADAKVFAVTWKGPTPPNLAQTLGDYYQQFKTATATSHADHHHLSVNSSTLVARSGGHMRAWSGRAYVPALLPPNFSLDDIK
jgi:Protein of unknown function (DUF2844)